MEENPNQDAYSSGSTNSDNYTENKTNYTGVIIASVLILGLLVLLLV